MAAPGLLALARHIVLAQSIGDLAAAQDELEKRLAQVWAGGDRRALEIARL